MNKQYVYIVEYPELDCEGNYVVGREYFYTLSEQTARAKVMQLNAQKDQYHLKAKCRKQEMI